MELRAPRLQLRRVSGCGSGRREQAAPGEAGAADWPLILSPLCPGSGVRGSLPAGLSLLFLPHSLLGRGDCEGRRIPLFCCFSSPFLFPASPILPCSRGRNSRAGPRSFPLSCLFPALPVCFLFAYLSLLSNPDRGEEDSGSRGALRLSPHCGIRAESGSPGFRAEVGPVKGPSEGPMEGWGRSPGACVAPLRLGARGWGAASSVRRPGSLGVLCRGIGAPHCGGPAGAGVCFGLG